MALCYRQMGDNVRALAVLREAARTLPQCAAEIALEEGNAHRALGDAAAAEGAFRRALTNTPRFTPASVNLARLLHEAGRSSEALACLDRGLGHCPGDAMLLTLRAQMIRAHGRLLLRQGQYEDARSCLAAIGDEPDAELWSLRGAAALGLNEIHEAVRLLRRSLEIEPTHEAVVNLRAALNRMLQVQTGRPRSASTAQIS
jgi:tetratricopeptide (TPR) repeat protein